MGKINKGIRGILKFQPPLNSTFKWEGQQRLDDDVDDDDDALPVVVAVQVKAQAFVVYINIYI